MKIKKIGILLFLLTIVNLSCNNKKKEIANNFDKKITDKSEEIKEIKSLENTEWIYKGKQINEVFIKKNEEITIDLGFKKELNGHAGCNSYFGAYKESTKNTAIIIKGIASTEMLCSDEVMKEEDAYLSILRKINKRKIIGNNILHLYFSDTDYLVFEKRTEVAIKTYKGKLVIGHEVNSIEIEDYKLGVWFLDSKNLVGEKYDKLTKNKKPYTPVFVEVKGKMLPKVLDGFAAEYGNVLEVTELIKIREIK
jgi:heat shock protein HslJ